MKSIRLLALSLLTTLTASAQTNTYPFPASGNIGIGTTGPWTSLHVQGPFTPGCMQLMVQSSGSDDRQGIAFFNAAGQRTGVIYTGPASGGDFILGREQSGMFRFFSGGGERLTIDSYGSIGIGTASPVGLLHLTRNNANAHLIVDPQSSGSGDSAIRLVRNGLNNEELRIIAAAGGASGQNNTYLFDTIGNPSARDIQFRTSTNGGASYSETLRITSAGNVGIGTTSPTRKLTVQGDVLLSDGERGSLIGHDGYNGGRAFLVLDKNSQNGTASGGDYIYLAQESNQAVLTSATGTPLNLGSGAASVSIAPSGNVGIGETNPTHKLAVNGTIKAKEVIVETTGWSDYVFADGYALQPLSEVEAHIKTNRHLPGIPSAAQVASEGVSVGEFQAKLLAKIEELTLHQIAQEKELATLRAEVRELRAAATK